MINYSYIIQSRFGKYFDKNEVNKYLKMAAIELRSKNTLFKYCTILMNGDFLLDDKKEIIHYVKMSIYFGNNDFEDYYKIRAQYLKEYADIGKSWLETY